MSSEPSDADLFGGCLIGLVTVLLFAVVVFTVFDYVAENEGALSACPSGVAQRDLRWNASDLVYFKVRCVNGDYRRINGTTIR